MYVANDPINFEDSSGLCKVSVGHHPVAVLYCESLGWLTIEHTYIILAEPGGTTQGHEPWVLDSGPSGSLCPWCKPTLQAAAATFCGPSGNKHG